MSEIIEILKYPFVIRALIAGSLISVCASILGVILVLKNYSLIGHGLSEIGFASITIASALKIPVILISTPSIISASFIIMYVSQKYKTSGDTAIAVASTISLSLGIIMSSLTGSFSSAGNIMFGSVLAVSMGDLIFSLILSAIVILLFVIFYNRLFLITYNEDFAKTLGINTSFYQALISILTALTVASGIKIMGTLLISGVIILPALSAKISASGFKMLVITSGLISLTAFITGLIVSFIFNIPTGAAIILTNTIILITLKVTKHDWKRA